MPVETRIKVRISDEDYKELIGHIHGITKAELCVEDRKLEVYWKTTKSNIPLDIVLAVEPMTRVAVVNINEAKDKVT